MKNLVNRVQELEDEILIKEAVKETRRRNEKAVNEARKIKVEKLPYGYDSLKKFIDPETMDVHYNKHYKGYVDKLNTALENKDAPDDLEKIVKGIKKFNKTVRNNAGGAYNHQLFWNMLTPKKMTPRGLIMKHITKNFGSLPTFKKKFEGIAKERFGSGWVWLILTDDDKLKIMSTPNQDNPLMNVIEGGGYPLLGLDLWEHAYYLRYRNKRDEYIKNFWNVVNWDFVENSLKSRLKIPLQESAKQLIFEEMKPTMCPAPTTKKYENFLNANENLYGEYRKQIDKHVQQFFGSLMRAANKEYGSGVYGLEGDENKRSLINNWNTNIAVFCYLAEEINKKVVSMGRDPFTFLTAENDEIKKSEFQRYLRAINYFKKDIFNMDGDLFKNIMGILDVIYGAGERREARVIEKMRVLLGPENVDHTGGHGKQEDFKGNDAKFIKDGTKHTAQIKPFWKMVKTKEGTYEVYSSGKIHKYRTDWMIFESEKVGVRVFDNKNVTLGDGKYIFPIESLLYTIS